MQMQTSVDSVAGARRGELLKVAIACIALFSALLSVTGSWFVFGRRFWLDEILTAFLAEAPGPVKLLTALTDGADFSPPLYYLIAWVSVALSPASTEVTLRVLSALATVGTVIAAYALLRRATGAQASAAGTVALTAHPLVIANCFEARCYALWICSVACLILAIVRETEKSSVVRQLSIALGSAAVCLCHYFGILALSLIAVGVVHACRKASWRILFPMLAGPASVLLCLPVLLGQRRALSVPTWLPPVDIGAVISFLGDLIPLTLILTTSLVLALFSDRRDDSDAPSEGSEFSMVFRLLAYLGLLPIVLILFSIFAQPSLLGRYAAPAVLAYTLPCALVCLRCGRRTRLAVLCAYALMATANFWSYANGRAREESRVEQAISTLRRVAEAGPLIFESRSDLYPIARYASDLGDRSFLIRFDRNRPRGLSPRYVIESEAATHVTRHFGGPHVIDYPELKEMKRAVLWTAFADTSHFSIDYPDFDFIPLQQKGFRLDLRDEGRKDK